MDLSSWFGLHSLHLGRGSRTPRQGLVLAGGGARASFQIGALSYLYDRCAMNPSVISATSAGSIVGSALAQWPDVAHQRQALHDLETMWLAMQQPEDMFTPRAWYTRFEAMAPHWSKLFEKEQKQQSSPNRRSLLPRWLAGNGSHGAGSDERGQDVTADATASRAGTSGAADIVEDEQELTGQAATLALATSDETIKTASWTPTATVQALSILSRLTRDGSDIAGVLRGADQTSSTHRAGPILAKLLDREFFRAEMVSSSGIKLRIATVALESGQLRYMTEQGILVDRNDDPIGSSTFDLSKGVLASCSIPGVFRPVDLDGEHYVDGGVRENIPVEITIERLGVTQPYVIAAAPSDMERAADFADRNMLDLASRTVSILTNETSRDELSYARSAGATIIEPNVDVHGSRVVDPGLLAINRDYGWMRAAAVCQNASQEVCEAIDTIVTARMQCWQLEKSWLAGETTREVRTTLENARSAIARTVAQIPDEFLESDSQLGDSDDDFVTSDPHSWSERMERHSHLEQPVPELETPRM
ncbi:patatin-like phospholipase family protein [Cutibacterium granulosum]|uniref:Phospholipase n=1 Tax=Cutibacterium granulosum TM11 TaxID=1292373 RepID=A0ACB4URE4_9ACTN|nr:patatin-like phospholipase family protein [Cutibacterium granulosum]ERF67922.1 phospholipase [Cutibacterium granulosum TM11]